MRRSGVTTSGGAAWRGAGKNSGTALLWYLDLNRGGNGGVVLA
jgi:hypothetical protein